MLRTTIVHIAILLAPTIVYLLFLIATKRVQLGRSQTAATLRALPWPWLIGSGLVLTAASLVALALLGGSEPDRAYVPPRLIDGEIQPAEVR